MGVLLVFAALIQIVNGLRPMDFTGRPMRGFISVAPGGVAKESDLARWVEEGAVFAATQPPKPR